MAGYFNRGMFSSSLTADGMAFAHETISYGGTTKNIADWVSLENRGKIYQSLSSLASQGLSGLSAGISASD